MLVDVLTGVLIGGTVLLALAVVAPPRRGRRSALPDRAAAGSPTSAPALVATRPRRPGSGAAGTPQADDVPTGAGMRPLDVWDALVVVLVLGMVLAVPVVGGLVAALLVPLLVLAPLLALSFLDRRAAAAGGRER